MRALKEGMDTGQSRYPRTSNFWEPCDYYLRRQVDRNVETSQRRWELKNKCRSFVPYLNQYLEYLLIPEPVPGIGDIKMEVCLAFQCWNRKPNNI